MWWDDQKIEAAVTRQFVCQHLLPQEIERLDCPLGFGDGLTDGTYWEWIDEKAKRIFLILVDLGYPDQIFGIIDDSWDDDDLPIALDQVERLALTQSRDEKADRKFYYRQFHYLLRHVEHGEHVVYRDAEVVPLDVVHSRSSRSQYVDKVILPNAPGEVFCRRKIPLGHGPGCLSHEDFVYEINSIRNIQNEHLVSYWGSYVYQGFGYVLFTPASDYTVHSLLTTTPTAIKSMDKHQRRRLVMNWIHCLADSLSYLHSRGLSHGNIKPSTILLNNHHYIFYSDFTRLNTELMAAGTDRSSFDKESYDYAAPEQWFKPAGGSRRPTVISPLMPPDNYTFSITRTDSASSAAMLYAPNPQLNPQSADVFSLGCIILELLSFIMKKQRSSFTSHRGAKHKTAGRGGAVLDSSFHKNLGQVETWIGILVKEASKKKDDPVMRGVPRMLAVVVEMLAQSPADRPSAQWVEKRMYQILTEVCQISEPHCVHQYEGWDLGLGRLHISSQAESGVFAVPGSIVRRTNSVQRNVGHRRTSSGGQSHSSHGSSHGSGQREMGSQSWRPRDPGRGLQGPMYGGNPYQDPLTC